MDGGAGADNLTGGSGSDIFRYLTSSDSGATAADRITDFRQTEGDRIDLSGIISGGGTLSFLGSGSFTNIAGQVRYSQQGGDTTLLIDLDGNGSGDMVVTVTGLITLTVNDLIL